MAEQSEELFQEFNLDDDSSLLNSLTDGVAAPVENQKTETTTNKSDNSLEEALMDFTLEDSREEIPIKQTTNEINETTQESESIATELPDTTPTNEDTPASEVDTSLYAPLASALHEQGLLPNLDVEAFGAEENQQEALFKAVEKEIDTGIDSFVESLPPLFKQQLLAYQQGVDLSTYQKLQKKELEYNNITETSLSNDEKLQKKVIKDDLLHKGFSEDKANKLIENFESLNELESESIDALAIGKARAKQASEKAIEDAKIRQDNINKQQGEAVKNISSSLESIKEIIPGKALNKISRDKVFKSMTTIVGNDKQGNAMNSVMATREKDPIKFETTLHYLHSLGIFNGDWSSVIKTAKTKAVTDLEQTLRTARVSSGLSPKLTGNNEGSVLDSL